MHRQTQRNHKQKQRKNTKQLRIHQPQNRHRTKNTIRNRRSSSQRTIRRNTQHYPNVPTPITPKREREKTRGDEQNTRHHRQKQPPDKGRTTTIQGGKKMIQILKANKNEIIVKQGQSIYSTTPETATPEVLEQLHKQQNTTKKTTTKKTEKPTNKKQETTKKTNTKQKTTKNNKPQKTENKQDPSKK